MTHDEMIAVIQAHKDGKKIQSISRSEPPCGWLDCDPDWDFPNRNYRVKPELKTGWINIYGDLSVSDIYPTRECAEDAIYRDFSPRATIQIQWEE